MDPLQNKRKLALQSPRAGSTVPPKLFALGSNHALSHQPAARKAGFTVQNGVRLDPSNARHSAQNSPRPGISPRGLGNLPHPLNNVKSKTQWLTSATTVLRFYAFFKEAVSESAVESYRVRKVTIMFYASDGTLEIVCHRDGPVTNSGMGGGVFLNRSHVPNPSGGIYASSDFVVGSDLSIFNRTFRIYDADANTRSLLPEQCGEKGVCPTDAFASQATKPKGPAKQARPSNRNRWLKQGSDGGDEVEILRFYAKWIQNEVDVVAGGTVRAELYKIHYYLEDGSLEILVSNPELMNYETHATLLSRQKACTSPRVSVSDIGERNLEYVSVEMLKVGQKVTIQDRVMLLYGADERTYKWYEENFETDMRKDEIDIRPPAPIKPEVSDEDDEEGLVFTKRPIGPVLSAKDKFYKQAHLAGKILRYAATVPDELKHPSEVEQKFVISYFLADDQISVYVRSPANSGLTSGGFLSKGVQLNMDTNKPFAAGDFYLGALVKFRNKTLRIDAVDDYSMGYTHMELGEIMGLVRCKIEEKAVNMHDVFRQYDDDKSQSLSYKEFEDAMNGSNLNLGELISKRDMMTLYRHFDRDGSGAINYLEFCATLQETDPFHATQDWKGNDPHEHFETEDMSAKQIDDYVHLLHKKELEGKKEIDLEAAMHKLVQFTHSHRNAGHTAALFRDFDLDLSGTLTVPEFEEVLKEKVHFTQRDVNMVLLKFFKPGVKELRYMNFLTAIQAYTDAKKKGKFLGGGKKPATIKEDAMKSLLFG